MLLSILIPTIVGREEKYEALKAEVTKQIADSPLVEIVTAKDNKEQSIGSKRQLLLQMATGKYVVFIDDDDWIADNYVGSILKALAEYPNIDSIGFRIECSGTKGRTASVSNIYDSWRDNHAGFDYVRTPYHKSPIKRDIALQIGYRDMRYAEDHDYSVRLKNSKLVKSEFYIDDVMYYYRYTFEEHNKKYGIK